MPGFVFKLSTATRGKNDVVMHEHVRYEPLVGFATTKVYSGVGTDIVIVSRTLIDLLKGVLSALAWFRQKCAGIWIWRAR
jgi:hypothetical protein